MGDDERNRPVAVNINLDTTSLLMEIKHQGVKIDALLTLVQALANATTSPGDAAALAALTAQLKKSADALSATIKV